MPVTKPTTGRVTPTATYRFQFNADFPFANAIPLAPYLRKLGISHLYSSPILAARAGSTHGYDVIDYDRINPELGGEAGFVALSDAMRAEGLGIILDIVPNHMAVGGSDNRLWLDVLRHGRASRYASWFDIDFDVDVPSIRGRVYAPFLGDPYAKVLADGGFKLQQRDDGYAIVYGEHLFPIRPEDDAEIRAQGTSAFDDPKLLDALIARQNFKLDWWRNAGDLINWRRFFEITQLAGVRIEQDETFDAAHRLTFDLCERGLIEGVRVDHIDGLADPTAYCSKLRERLDAIAHTHGRPRPWLIAEKILGAGERLPAAWPLDGTTGYDFMNEVSAVQHDDAGAARLNCLWGRIGGRTTHFYDEEVSARQYIAEHSFDGHRERLVDAVFGLAARAPEKSLTRSSLRRALTALCNHIRVYRTYWTGREAAAADPHFTAAVESALAEPGSDGSAIAFVVDTLSGVGPEYARIVKLFNHLTAPLAAKAVEDTGFYRYLRLISRNDVGFDADRLGIGPAEFHALMQARVRDMPRSMLTTATHDHKRGEDARARLAVLSEIPDRWEAAVVEWFDANAGIHPDGLHPADEYFFYQTLVGAWPLAPRIIDDETCSDLATRIKEWSVKALREGKLRSAWATPHEDYETRFGDFIDAALDRERSAAFLADFARFVQTIAAAGAANGLVQTVLRCLAPGIPDTYRGCEYWDFSLVDPDNRRPVDFAARASALEDQGTVAAAVATWRDGHVKQRVLRDMLGLRHAHPAVFAGDYVPLKIKGSRAENALAFLRVSGREKLLVVVARCCADGLLDDDRLVPDAAWWGDTQIADDLVSAGPTAISALLQDVPFAAHVLS